MANKIVNAGGEEVCSHCGSGCFRYRLKIINPGRPEWWYPKYVPQIKESCAACGEYIRFATQTDELIEKFNGKLREVQI